MKHKKRELRKRRRVGDWSQSRKMDVARSYFQRRTVGLVRGYAVLRLGTEKATVFAPASRNESTCSWPKAWSAMTAACRSTTAVYMST